MSESSSPLPSPAQEAEFPDDLVDNDYEALPLAAKVAWLRYAYSMMAKRDARIERLYRLFKALAIASGCILVIAFASLSLSAYVVVSSADKTDIRNQQYDYTQRQNRAAQEQNRVVQEQIRRLVCAVPPGNPYGDVLRRQANCGTYVAPSSTPSGGSGKPTPTPTRSPAAATPQPSGTIEQPARTPQPTPAGSRPAAAPRATTTRVERVPGRTSTRTATRTTTRTAPAPSPTPTGLLGVLLCPVLGCA